MDNFGLALGALATSWQLWDHDQRLAALRRLVRSQSSVNASQDQQQQMLALENEQLRLCLAMLIGLLIDKGVMTAEEAAGLLSMTDPVPAPATPSELLGQVADDESHEEAGEADESVELEQVQQAAREVEQERPIDPHRT